MIVVEVVVVTCRCGTFPLEAAMHRTSSGAWQAGADHVTLTSRAGKAVCTPQMFRDTVPAALAPR